MPIILILPLFTGINGILYAQPAADVISAVVTVFMALRLHRELHRMEDHVTMPLSNHAAHLDREI